ncbi:hypothetical protein CPC698_1286B, partial [Chlamydia psittaci C6/98]
SKPD